MSKDACPHCKSSVPPDAHACPLCLLAVRREGGQLVAVYPDIRPGPLLYGVDLRVTPLIGMDFTKLQATGVLRFQLGEGGLAVDIAARKAFEWQNPYVRLRDACIRVRLQSFTGASRVMVIARGQQIGPLTSQYAFVVSLERREACLARMIGAALGTQSPFTPLTKWSTHAALSALGPFGAIELRVQSSTLEGLIDGQRVAVTHDPVLGIGRCGLRLESEHAPSRMVLASTEIAAVVA